MSSAALFMWAVVGCVGILSRRNLTAFVLAFAWVASQAWYLKTDEGLGFYADMIVIVGIFAKATIHEGTATYPTLRNQLYRCWASMTLCDLVIIALYLFAVWPIYLLNLDPWANYWSLYWITVAQFLFAGAEALLGHYHARFTSKDDRPQADIIPFASRRAERLRTAAAVSTVRGGWGSG